MIPPYVDEIELDIAQENDSDWLFIYVFDGIQFPHWPDSAHSFPT